MKVRRRTAAAVAVVPALLLAAALSTAGCRPDVLGAIEARGAIVAGTSADLPPFTFREPGENGTDRLRGLDIELLDEVAARLRATVEWKDMKAGDLPGALEDRAIDVAVGDMVENPDLAAKVAFTEPYLVSPEVVVAKKGLAIAIADLAQLAGHRVGVEAGSPEESYCRAELVGGGTMAETGLSSYPEPSDAIEELLAGRVDLAFVDASVASAALESGEVVKLLETRLPHEPVIAVARGQADLVARLNEIIDTLRQEGFLERLANKYGVDGR